ncbi:MAG TPA: OmpA family protein, partial [Polyangia bacterium]|nr:OmpA family protein [Polyangia bacterium]
SNGYLGVDGAFVAPHLGFSVGLYDSYAHDALVLRAPVAEPLMTTQLGGDLVASFAVLNRLELGIDLPFSYQRYYVKPLYLPPLRSTVLGDLRLELKALLWAPTLAAGQRLGISFIAGFGAPTGDTTSFVGQDGWTGRFRLVGEWRASFLSVAVDFGAVVRSERDFGDLHVGSQLQWGVGLGVPLPLGFGLIGEARGLIGVGLPRGDALSRAEAPAELTVGARWRARFGLELVVAGGTGLSRGYGTPDGRIIGGIRYTSPERAPKAAERDSDNDGVLDRVDKCPSEPGPATNGGCPLPADSDGDGVSDIDDKCPNEPGARDNGGCPDVDSDGDGVVDRLDRCPNQIGPAVNHGCPLADRDRDGVPDAADRCPDKAGPVANQGCPDFDSDGDGLVDRLDKCPFDPETYNGVADEDGCPDQPAALAAWMGDKIVIFEPILFVNDGSVVDKRSVKLLGVIARLMNLHAEVLKFRVEGHMDNKGSGLALLELSRARAASVRRWLVDVGHVDARRLTAQGFGSDKPVADNRDFIGRAKNRRIDFVVIQKLDSNP